MSTKHRSPYGRVALLVLLAVGACPTGAYAFAGFLHGPSAIFGSGNWGRHSIRLSWNVRQNADRSWHYAYVFSHSTSATGQLVIEAAPDLAFQDIFNARGDFRRMEVGTWGADGGANAGIPGSVYGLRFGETSGLTTRVSFDTWRAPGWGDFYASDSWRTARGGRSDSKASANRYGQSYAYNLGFASGIDEDPTVPPGSGAVRSHMLVPDANGLTPVPEPSSILLLASGLFGIGAFAKRRRR